VGADFVFVRPADSNGDSNARGLRWTLALALGEDGVERGDRLALHGRRDMAIEIQCRADAGVPEHWKQERTCEVVQTDDATPGSAQSGVRFRLDDGTEHRSPSSAGKQAMGGVACNGWRFWSLQGDLKPAKEPKAKKAKAEQQAKAPAKKAAKKSAKKGAQKTAKKKSARMASSGSYGCGACGQEFPTMKLATAHALTHTAA